MTQQGRVIHVMSIVGNYVLAAMLVVEVLLIVNVGITNNRQRRDEATAYITSCKHTNAVAHGLLDQTIFRSKNALKATLSSPTETAAQKTAAKANLASLLAYQKHQEAVLSDKLCVFPPVPVPN